MKLKNKKTGKIVTFDHIGLNNDVDRSDGTDDDVFFALKEDRFYSLAELCERFEDAPEEIKSWEEVVQIKELPSGLKIADRDYYEVLPDGTKKTEFTWDEAMEIEKRTNGKWRAPSSKELNQIAIDLGYSDEGDFDGKLLADNLGIREKFDEEGYMDYWSRTLSSTTYSRYLLFRSTRLNPTVYTNKGYGFAVRCVAVPAASES